MNRYRLNPDIINELMINAKLLMTNGKVLLAFDDERILAEYFSQNKIENTLENRIACLEMICSARQLDQYCSGIILNEELSEQTIHNKTVPEFIANQNIMAGIKANKGMNTLLNSYNESYTTGLDTLKNDLIKLYTNGCRFANWKALFKVQTELELSENIIRINAHSIAIYASICQECRLVPIIEIKVIDEGHHEIYQTYEITVLALSHIYRELRRFGVHLEATLLRMNMITPGGEVQNSQMTPSTIILCTLKALSQCVPVAVPGIIFTNGGFTNDTAIRLVDYINKRRTNETPWIMTGVFNQISAIKKWAGKKELVESAQNELINQLQNCSKAALGMLNKSLSNEPIQLTSKSVNNLIVPSISKSTINEISKSSILTLESDLSADQLTTNQSGPNSRSKTKTSKLTNTSKMAANSPTKIQTPNSGREIHVNVKLTYAMVAKKTPSKRKST